MQQENHNKQPPYLLWLWAGLLVGAILLFLLSMHAPSKKSVWIQQDIGSPTEEHINAIVELTDFTIQADGRDITLDGVVANEDSGTNVKQIASETFSVRQVHNQIEIQEKSQQLVESDSEKLTQVQVRSLPTNFLILSAQAEYLPEQPPPQESSDGTNTGQMLNQLDFSSITFKKSSTAPTTDVQKTLDNTATTLLEHPAVKISVEGHTDSSGNPDQNLNLSKQRTQSVADYLSASGIENSRIEVAGFGNQLPISSNQTLASQIQNRRIEIKVISGE